MSLRKTPNVSSASSSALMVAALADVELKPVVTPHETKMIPKLQARPLRTLPSNIDRKRVDKITGALLIPNKDKVEAVVKTMRKIGQTIGYLTKSKLMLHLSDQFRVEYDVLYNEKFIIHIHPGILEEGGNGYVVSASDGNDWYAIKILNAKPGVIEAAKNELKLSLRLGLFLVANEEKCFLVMRYVPGIDLERIVEIDETAVPLLHQLYIMKKTNKQLQELHEHHIVHRDIKLGNIMVQFPNVEYVDFGGALELAPSETELEVKKIAGTLHFMPKKLRCAAEGDKINPYENDIYSLGYTWGTMFSFQDLNFYNMKDQDKLLAYQGHTIVDSPTIDATAPDALIKKAMYEHINHMVNDDSSKIPSLVQTENFLDAAIERAKTIPGVEAMFDFDELLKLAYHVEKLNEAKKKGSEISSLCTEEQVKLKALFFELIAALKLGTEVRILETKPHTCYEDDMLARYLTIVSDKIDSKPKLTRITLRYQVIHSASPDLTFPEMAAAVPAFDATTEFDNCCNYIAFTAAHPEQILADGQVIIKHPLYAEKILRAEIETLALQRRFFGADLREIPGVKLHKYVPRASPSLGR